MSRKNFAVAHNFIVTGAVFLSILSFKNFLTIKANFVTINT